MRLSIPLAVSVGAIVIAAACGGGQPAPPPEPAIDSAVIRDSIARTETARVAQEDSILRAQEAAERIVAEKRADSLEIIARETERVRNTFTAHIHFDFDKSNIRSEDAAILDQKIAIMEANPALTITITGHCDERGSDEYNLALGNRRALAAMQYVTARGIAPERITTASRGEEDPVDSGHNEDAWSQNRRDEFMITAGGQSLRAPSGM
ncbi:MAG: OmpA family protein [Gemmatimonadetes bacterium]|nr:OmpA family protein [Gemmatimonadota bacterium]